jgi:hypothetical protein
MTESLNSLSKDDILDIFAAQDRRIKRLEALLQGQPLSVVKIANASIEDAKIVSLSVDKLTSGRLSVSTIVYIGDEGSGDYIEEDGGNGRIVMYKDDVAQLLIGEED